MSFYRKRHIKPQDDVDSWLMTYADMITLLLCFFVIFIIISNPSQEKLEAATKAMKEEFNQKKDAKFEILVSLKPNTNLNDSLLNELNSVFRGDTSISNGEEGTDKEKASAKEESKRPEEEPYSPISMLKYDKGIIIELDSAFFYKSGSAELKEVGKEELMKIVGLLTRPGYQVFNVNIQGHTDDSPINTPLYPSNWELSTNRATNVLRFLISQGVETKRLKAEGYADTFPKLPNRDESGKAIPENQAKNRRVILKLEKSEDTNNTLGIP